MARRPNHTARSAFSTTYISNDHGSTIIVVQDIDKMTFEVWQANHLSNEMTQVGRNIRYTDELGEEAEARTLAFTRARALARLPTPLPDAVSRPLSVR